MLGHVFEQFRAVHRFPHVDTSDECSPLFFLGYLHFRSDILKRLAMATFSTSGFTVSTLINAQDVIYVQGGKMSMTLNGKIRGMSGRGKRSSI